MHNSFFLDDRKGCVRNFRSVRLHAGFYKWKKEGRMEKKKAFCKFASAKPERRLRSQDKEKAEEGRYFLTPVI